VWLYLGGIVFLLSLALHIVAHASVLGWLLSVREDDPDLAASVYRTALMRLQAREQVPADQDGYARLCKWADSTGAPMSRYVTGKTRSDVEAALRRDLSVTEGHATSARRGTPFLRELAMAPGIQFRGPWRGVAKNSPYLRFRALGQHLYALGLFEEMRGAPGAAAEAYALAASLGARAA